MDDYGCLIGIIVIAAIIYFLAYIIAIVLALAGGIAAIYAFIKTLVNYVKAFRSVLSFKNLKEDYGNEPLYIALIGIGCVFIFLILWFLHFNKGDISKLAENNTSESVMESKGDSVAENVVSTESEENSDEINEDAGIDLTENSEICVHGYLKETEDSSYRIEFPGEYNFYTESANLSTTYINIDESNLPEGFLQGIKDSEITVTGDVYFVSDNVWIAPKECSDMNGNDLLMAFEQEQELSELHADYILPQSDSIQLTEEDINNLSLQELNYAKNEIYARHGRKFDSMELRKYFESKDWYQGTIDPADFDDSMLNKTERANVILIRDMEYSIDPNGYPLDQGDSSSIINSKTFSMDSVSDIYASSSLSEYDMTHSPERVADGDRSTAWVEGVSGQGEGESLTMEFNDTYEIHGFKICAGYQKSKDLYKKNSRPSVLQVIYENGDSERYELADKNKAQTVELSAPIRTSSVTFVIDSVYPGNKYEDTVISEITIF